MLWWVRKLASHSAVSESHNWHNWVCEWLVLGNRSCDGLWPLVTDFFKAPAKAHQNRSYSWKTVNSVELKRYCDQPLIVRSYEFEIMYSTDYAMYDMNSLIPSFILSLCVNMVNFTHVKSNKFLQRIQLILKQRISCVYVRVCLRACVCVCVIL